MLDSLICIFYDLIASFKSFNSVKQAALSPKWFIDADFSGSMSLP